MLHSKGMCDSGLLREREREREREDVGAGCGRGGGEGERKVTIQRTECSFASRFFFVFLFFG